MLKNLRVSPAVRFSVFVAVITILLCAATMAQTTLSTGSIVGSVTDPSGAVLSGANVTITSTATAQTIDLTTNSAGAYNSGPLTPGVYKVQLSAKGFNTVTTNATVQVGNIATVNGKMSLGQETTTIEVQGSAIQVNTEQPTVQGVLTANQIENLPVNGRNFLDLAQLEPGVQIQDGQNFDPTKAGYSSISFGGRFGRTARIEVDGVDVSDETVGTTTTDIPASAIQEFQISQSSLDMSSELTSSGAVNVTTKSGTNAIHGQAFGLIRDSSIGAAALPTPPGFSAPFQRSQYGGDLGGPVIRDKMFFYMDGERTIQHTQVPVPISAPFQAFSGTFSDAFHEGNLLGKLDYQFANGAKLFYRMSYFKNSLGATFGYGYSVYNNVDITRNHVVGIDFNTGSFTHAIRFSYLKFQNQIVDATTGSTTLPFANVGAELFMGSSGLVAGPNLLAPQSTPQSNRQIRYDGSRIIGSHVIRYGMSFNHVQGGGFASFFKNGPQVASSVSQAEIAAAASGPFPGGSSNPLNYPADDVVVANGLGFSTINPALGFPAGGLGPDNRILVYLGDTWKIKGNFALTYGLRYQRDTGRTDSQYPAIPGLNALFPGLGNQVRQPNSNLAPQLGFAWDPMKNGKTSIRGGIGLFWENAVWNNVLFDGPPREPTGAFLQFFGPCAAVGSPVPLQTANGTITPSAQVCGNPNDSNFPLIGNALPAIIALQQAYVAGSPLNLNASNPAYAGQYLSDCGAVTSTATNCFFAPGASMFNPNYRSPRSIQMNIGIQREIHHGMVVSADYVRNVQTHFLLGVDQNHAGDVSFFNQTAATDAIDVTNSSFGCPAGPAGVDCAIAAGATMGSYAGFGLGSASDMGGNSCAASLAGNPKAAALFPNGYPCAFGGKNPNAPPVALLSPVGRSVYSGLQAKWAYNVTNPVRGMSAVNFQVSYALSRFENSGGGVRPDANVTASSGDQDFIVPALDNGNVNRYFGPSTLDRTHQISFGGYMNFRGGFQLGLISHFYSPLSTTLTVPNTGSGAGEIFRTDFTGDGTTQDPMPGTKVGEFMRGINASNINQRIANFNANVVGQPTPAGQALIGAGLMTASQLSQLGGVANGGVPLPLAPSDQVNLAWLRALDMTIGWSHTFKERVTIKPTVGFFNLPNFVNFDLPQSMLSGSLNGSPGSINGTNYAGHFVNRVGVGTGVYSLGSPRQTEFSLKVIF
jgi:Carboxypeptidase regulatory-like domain